MSYGVDFTFVELLPYLYAGRQTSTNVTLHSHMCEKPKFKVGVTSFAGNSRNSHVADLSKLGLFISHTGI